MRKLNKILILIFLGSIAFISYKVTFSFFSDTGSSTSNTFAAATTFPTPTPSPCPSPTVNHTVINEFSSDEGKKTEWVELFNPTCSSVDVSGWKIADGNTEDTFPTVNSIPAQGYAVVITSTSTVIGIPASAITIQLGNDNIGSGLNDNGDALHLKNPSNTIIDEVSYGTNHDVFNPAPSAPPANQTLARSPNGVDTDAASDWAIDTTPSKGVTN